MTITNKAFREAMKKAGLEKVELCKNGDYFYICSEDEETSLWIIGTVKENMIPAHAFKDLSINQWVEEIKDLLN